MAVLSLAKVPEALRQSVVDSLTREILQELGGGVEAFGSKNPTSDYDISFFGPKAQIAVIFFNARFNARWGAAIDIGGRETGVTLDTNAYTRSEHLNFRGGEGDLDFQDSYAHLAARKYLGDADWAAYRARIEAASDPAKLPDLRRILDGVEAEHKELTAAIDAKKAELKGTVADSDLGITAENRLYEETLKQIAELIERFDGATAADKPALAQRIRNAQSRALFYAQEAYNTQAAIVHVVTTIQAGTRAITADSLLGENPPKLNVPLTPEQARQSYIEQIANMMKELSHEGDPAKLASKAAKYFVRALDAAKIAGIDLKALEAIVRATVVVNDKRAEIVDVQKALAELFPQGGAEAYLAGVNAAVDALNRAFFGAVNGAGAANDNTADTSSGGRAPALLAGGEAAADGKAATGASTDVPFDPNAETAVNQTAGQAPQPQAAPSGSEAAAARQRAFDPGAETIAGPAKPSPEAQADGTSEAAAAARSAYRQGLDQLTGDPMFARWLQQPITDIATLRKLALIGLMRGLIEPVDKIQADLALSAAEGLINISPELAGIDLLEVAKYVNLHAGRAASDGETGMPAQLAVEALLQINPTARIRIRDVVAAAGIDGSMARTALNGARSVIGRQHGQGVEAADSLDRHPLTSYTANPVDLLARLDGSYLIQRPRAGTPGDAQFFAVNDLLPRLTIEVGGQRFHITDPFRGPRDRVAVVAFQETSEGTLVPRTFYLSGEHGVWRAAVAIANDLLSKGPMRLVYGGREISFEQLLEVGGVADTQFINESAVDLGAEMQGILARWSQSRGVRDLAPEVTERAFYGHLERTNFLNPGVEFSAFVSREDIEHVLIGDESRIPENLLPDLATGALDQWQVQSQVYGRMRGATYLSRDGSVIYVVLRDAQGRVFVPSIQDAKVGLTPFGTRWSAYETTLNSTPMVHGARDYVANDNYQNALNRLFR